MEVRKMLLEQLIEFARTRDFSGEASHRRGEEAFHRAAS
jgi:hypothetical protein